MQLSVPAPQTRRIPLTSLVDVVFILLFFFMLASHHQNWRSFDLLASDDAAMATESDAPKLTVLLLATGQMRASGKALSRPELQAWLRQSGAQAQVTIVPAHTTSLQTLVDLMDEVQALGAVVLLAQAKGS